MKQRVCQRGFSLLELVLVVSILAVMTAAVTPVFRQSLINSKRDDAMTSLLAALRYAQERSVCDSTEYRVYLDIDKGAYWVARVDRNKDGEDVVEPAPEPFLRRMPLPEGLEFRRPTARRDRDLDAYYVAFYPHGASDFATIRLRSTDRRFRATIKTKGAMGQYDLDRNR